jgi:hypothetical protein
MKRVRARSAEKSGGRVLWWSPAPAVDDDDIEEDEEDDEEEEVAGGEMPRSSASSVAVAVVGLRSRQLSPLAGSTRSMTCTTGERGGVLIRMRKRSSGLIVGAVNGIVNQRCIHQALDQSLMKCHCFNLILILTFILFYFRLEKRIGGIG